MSTPQALYRPVPQSDAALTSSDIEIEAEDEVLDQHITANMIDTRIRWINFIFGCALLLPWNALITAMPYFLSRLTGSQYKSTFGSYLSSSFTAASFIVLIYSTATSTQSSPSRRIFYALLFLASLTSLLTITTYIHVSPGIFFSFVLVNAIVQACVGSYLQPAVIALASLFGPTAVHAVMSGQGAVGVVVSGVQVLSATASVWGTSAESVSTYLQDGTAEEKSAFIFFSLSTVFFLGTIFALRWLTAMPAYKSVMVMFEERQKRLDSSSRDLGERGGLVSGGRSNLALEGKGQILRVAKANATYEIAVAYVFIVTLSVFPPITISITSTRPNVNPLLFGAYHFLVFNVADFGGRTICAYPSVIIWSAKRLLTLSLARTLFIPLFLMCNIQRSPLAPPSTPIINSDILYMLILIVFGFSNGYVSSLCMMSAPSLEHNPRLKGRREDVDVAATLASFCLVGGLAIGSIASFAVRAAVCDCNPFRL